MRRIKVVMCGDEGVGKTYLLTRYKNDNFPPDYTACAFDSFEIIRTIGRKVYTLTIYDTPGQTEYDIMRPMSYAYSDVILLCFSVVNIASFVNIKDKWLPEITLHRPKTPYLLVGTQIDLRNDAATIKRLAKRRMIPISYERGEYLAEVIGAAKYVECSSFTKDGLRNVFDEAVGIVLMNASIPIFRRCCIL